MPTYAHTNRVRAAGRYGLPLLGSRQAAGGLLEDLPVDLLARRDYFTYFNDFTTAKDFLLTTSDDNDPDLTAWEWVALSVGSPAAQSVAISAALPNGQLVVDAGTANSTGVTAQLVGSSSDLVGGGGGEFLALDDNSMDGKLFAWEARFRVDNASNGAVVLGLMETDVTPVSTAGAVTTDNALVFVMADGGALTAHAERATNVTTASTGLTVANNTWVQVGMRCYHSDVSSATATNWADVYVNGAFVTRLQSTTNGVIPNVGLSPIFAAVNDGSNDINLYVDYVWVAIQR